MELLMYEKSTAFRHRLWDRYKLLSMYEYSPRILENHNRQLLKFDYSPIQDAFYALTGGYPNGSPVGRLWADVMASKTFAQVQTEFPNATLDQQVNFVYWLGLYYEYFIREEDAPEPTPPPQPDLGLDQQPSPDDDDDDDDDDDEGSSEEDDNPSDNGAGDQEGDQPGNSEIESYDLEGDKTDDILTGGQGLSEEPSDIPANPNANVKPGFKLVSPSKGQELDASDVEAQNDSDEIFGTLAGTGDSNPTEKRRMMEKFHMTKAIKNLSKFLGFAERVSKAAERKTNATTGIAKTYTKGSWDARVTTRERRAIVQHDPQALMRFAGRKLRKRQVESETPVGNGDVIILRDESSSMRDKPNVGRHYGYDISRMPKDAARQWQKFLDHPDSDTQAVNLEVALAYQFYKSGREVTSVAWDHASTRVYKYGDPGIEQHLSSFLNGGTSINHALTKALDLIDRGSRSDFADMLILTDADINDSPDEEPELAGRIKAYRANGGRIWAVLIGCSESDARTIRQWVDGAIAVEDLMKGEDKLEKLLVDMSITRFESDRKNV